MTLAVAEKSKTKEYFSASWRSNHLRLLALVQASWVSRLIYFAVKRDIFEKITEGNTHVENLSQELGINKSVLRRILKGLEHLELLIEIDSKFELTDLGRLLLKSAPKNMAYMSLLWGEEFGNAWTKFSDAVDNNTTGFEAYYDEKIFEYFSHEPESATNFNFAMNSVSQLLYPSVVKQLPVADLKSFVDVGGGRGNLVKLIAEAYPDLDCSLYDLESVVSEVQANQIRQPFKSIGGDFFKEVPRADAHLMSNVLHDWNDEECIQILNNVRKAQTGNGYLFLLEMCVEHDKEPLLARSTDLNMLIFTGGRERSLAEFKALFAKCGFRLESLSNVEDMTCLLVAKPI